MSLFGGSAPRPRSSYESDTPESSSVPSSPSVVETEDPGDIPEIHTLDAAAAEEEEDTDTDSRAESNESEDDEEESEKTARVRRNTNQAQKWRNTTEGELQIMDSIEQMEAEDLVAHLYNTHALKRRVRRPTQDLAQLKSWQGRDSWLKTGKDLEFKDAAGLVQPELVPPKAWTAWPDSPEKLLRSKTQWASDFALEWHIGGVRDALEELKEELLAIFYAWRESSGTSGSLLCRNRTLKSLRRLRVAGREKEALRLQTYVPRLELMGIWMMGK
ncbi:hypothetical protein P3342_011473 [Pyrenophora teres f. teres]|nr:hypothetical protein P3342_011473 [Pyrenophora teres f. teres]